MHYEMDSLFYLREPATASKFFFFILLVFSPLSFLFMVLATSAFLCPVWACCSNAIWWSCLCRRWRRYGTTDKHSQFEQDRRRRAVRAGSSSGSSRKSRRKSWISRTVSDMLTFDKYGWLHKDPCGLFSASLTHFFICGRHSLAPFISCAHGQCAM